MILLPDPNPNVKPAKANFMPTQKPLESLAVEAKTDPKSFSELLRRCNGLVRGIAKRFANRGRSIEMSDLIQIGNNSLRTAVEKFDPARGTAFIAYAQKCIINDVIKSVAEDESLLDGPVKKKLHAFYGKQEAESVDSFLGRDAVVSFDRVNVTSGRTLHELVSLSEAGPEDANLRIDLESLRDTLNERESYILEHRLMSSDPETLQEIGDRYGVSRERVRQIEWGLICYLKSALSPYGTENFVPMSGGRSKTRKALDS